MAEVLVGALVNVLIEKLLSGELNFGRSEKINSQLKKLETTLPMIKALLADASKKQITDPAVEVWLNNLHELAYDIDDVLDDLATEAMKRNFKESRASASASTSSKVLKMIPTSLTPPNIMYGRNISSKLDEITTRLHDLFEQTNILRLNVNGETSTRTNKRLEETSLLPDDVSEILGREGDKEALLGKLLGGEEESSKQNVSIVSIVGMGGIGKTTLARLLYNDQKVKDHFELRAWVCVSDDFDVFNISNQIYQYVGGEDKTFNSLDQLHVALKEKLSNRRFLLVLDDVWNDDQHKWEALKRALVGAARSKVIVTTRNTMVASVMSSVQPHNLGFLSDENAMSLFAKYALNEENFDNHPLLESIARGIIKKCDGLPLALKALGRVLKNKGNDEWEELLNSEIWNLEDESGILFEQKNNLGLNVSSETSNRTNKRVPETSLLPDDVSEILGREGDKEALLGKLLGDEGACSNQNVSIVSIVGMGGIGKTTLARLLYNDQKVNDHFELRVWVCVSDDFDVINISKQIYQAVGGFNQDFASLDQLHVALKEKLSNKRFLLVLDDVWNDDQHKWEALKRALVGAAGSKVIVTTRNTMVALAMNSVQPHNLGFLSDENAMSLFAKYALNEENFDNHPLLESIARGIIKKCDGLPLALKALGRVLKNKGNDEWKDLLNREIWNLEDESGILPALKLSYYDLPSHLKQLFAYCSLFPKDHEFDKNKLVLKWMAQGFLSQTRGGKSMETLGSQYFEELRLRCFFQPSTNDESRYTMHDLMNDLAISVAGKFFFRLDDKVDINVQNEAFEKFRHFSFIGQRHPEYRKFKELHRARYLQTFLPVSVGGEGFNRLSDVLVQLLTRLRFLRVLSLTHHSITNVPQSIGNLKNLRYLNFSSTSIKHLPEQVGKLYNLQSLLVRDCSDLSSLPVSFVKLINLRHLDMTRTRSLKKLPLGIGGLTSLQTLSKVFIKGGNGFKISELKGLSDLQGRLSIKGLDKVKDPEEAKDANSQQKKGLDDLALVWSDVLDDSRDPVIEYEVLEKLRPPHCKLKKLKIKGYGGMKFPSWLGDPSFDQLTELTLRGCENCTDLPTLGHLSSLRKLCLSSMKAVKSVGFELPTPTNALLESLEVHDMQSLEIWSTSGGDNDGTPRSFPSLRVISIKECPELAKVSFGLIPALTDLTVEECPEAVLRDLVGVSSSIRTLNLKAIKGLAQLDREVLKHLGEVEDLSINGCHELRYLWESESEACGFLRSLQKLKIIGCSKLESIKGEKEVVNVGSSIMGSLRKVRLSYCDSLESYCCPTSVERLEIWNCSSMTSLTFSKLQEELPSSSLMTLNISICENLKSISYEHLQSLTSLEEMLIYRCPRMEDSLPSWGGGGGG